MHTAYFFYLGKKDILMKEKIFKDITGKNREEFNSCLKVVYFENEIQSKETDEAYKYLEEVGFKFKRPNTDDTKYEWKIIIGNVVDPEINLEHFYKFCHKENEKIELFYSQPRITLTKNKQNKQTIKEIKVIKRPLNFERNDILKFLSDDIFLKLVSWAYIDDIKSEDEEIRISALEQLTGIFGTGIEEGGKNDHKPQTLYQKIFVPNTQFDKYDNRENLSTDDVEDALFTYYSTILETSANLEPEIMPTLAAPLFIDVCFTKEWKKNKSMLYLLEERQISDEQLRRFNSLLDREDDLNKTELSELDKLADIISKLPENRLPSGRPGSESSGVLTKQDMALVKRLSQGNVSEDDFKRFNEMQGFKPGETRKEYLESLSPEKREELKLRRSRTFDRYATFDMKGNYIREPEKKPNQRRTPQMLMNEKREQQYRNALSNAKRRAARRQINKKGNKSQSK